MVRKRASERTIEDEPRAIRMDPYTQVRYFCAAPPNGSCRQKTPREPTMRLLQVSIIAGMSLGAVVLCDGRAVAQDAAALSGQVSSAEEGAMEGVLVSAHKDGSSITTTVVTDDKGHYTFPAARLEPGPYAIAIRAVGYQLDGPKRVEVKAGATADLKLSKTRKLASQLSNGEWLMSLPGADKQKAFLTQCVGCHTLARIVSSTHDAAE